ncbi:MAG: hypothetical protein GWN71_26040, partial [Gammaproteobacteria bacterium]|nr:hypothetical protein [Gemmatimonadota bacterium]NIU76894.1 hypothetical protein [Gammaproteobacteria bacterium]NIX22885.1 hypothetical protein [Actinomycetota bacterium]
KAGGGRGDSGGGNRTRSGLVVAEVALSLVLLSGAGLMLDTLVRLQAIDPGFEPEGRLSVRINPPEADYPGAAEIRDFYDRVLRRLGSLPGVESAALVNTVPTGGSRWRSDSWTI